MGKIAAGYGSEWHLLSYLGRHRAGLDRRVCERTGARGVEWIDFPVTRRQRLLESEWKGLDFIEDTTVRQAWAAFWPQHRGVPNWDAVGRAQYDDGPEWLLVEAKSHVGEIQSGCAAKNEGGLGQIEIALRWTKTYLGVDTARNWLRPYYQFCNRLAVLAFLNDHGVRARLLCIYFTGDQVPGAECPKDESGWRLALDGQSAHVGLPREHRLAGRIHTLFVPAFANLHSGRIGWRFRGVAR